MRFKELTLAMLLLFLLSCKAVEQGTGESHNNTDDYSYKTLILRDVPDQPNPLFVTLQEAYDSLMFGIDSVVVYDLTEDRALKTVNVNKTITLDSLVAGVKLGIVPFDTSLYYLFYMRGVDSIRNIWVTSMEVMRVAYMEGWYYVNGELKEPMPMVQTLMGDSVLIVNSRIYESSTVVKFYGQESIWFYVSGDTAEIRLGPGTPGVGFPNPGSIE